MPCGVLTPDVCAVPPSCVLLVAAQYLFLAGTVLSMQSDSGSSPEAVLSLKRYA